MTEHPFTETLSSRFGGVLRHGKHAEDGEACALEAASVARGRRWSDKPGLAGLPDLRPLNDARWPDDATRTEHMLPVVLALWDWAEWKPARRKAWAKRVAERTIREVLPIALRAAGLDAEAERCEREGTREAANAAHANAANAAHANAAHANAAHANAAAYAANAAHANAAHANAAAYAAYAFAAAYANAYANAVAYAAAAANAAAYAYAAAARVGGEPLIVACRIWASEAAA
jgi:hypothetical protein